MVLRGYIIPAEVSEKHCVAIRDGSEEIDRFEIFSLLLSKIITNSLSYLIPNESKFSTRQQSLVVIAMGIHIHSCKCLSMLFKVFLVLLLSTCIIDHKFSF